MKTIIIILVLLLAGTAWGDIDECPENYKFLSQVDYICACQGPDGNVISHKCPTPIWVNLDENDIPIPDNVPVLFQTFTSVTLGWRYPDGHIVWTVNKDDLVKYIEKGWLLAP